MPTASELRQDLEGLLGLADSGLRTVTTDPQLALTHAWFVRCVDSTRAALLLSDAGLSEIAAPLVRAAIEHAVGMEWLQRLGEDALAAVLRSHKRWADNVRKAIDAANQEEKRPGREDWSPALDAAFEELSARDVPTGQVPGEWKIDPRFKIAHEFDLYVAWLAETGGSHATHTSAAPYVVVDEQRYHLLRMPQVVTAEPAFVVQCATAVIGAFRAMGKALDSEIWQANVDALDQSIAASYEQLRVSGELGHVAADWLSRHAR